MMGFNNIQVEKVEYIDLKAVTPLQNAYLKLQSGDLKQITR